MQPQPQSRENLPVMLAAHHRQPAEKRMAGRRSKLTSRSHLSVAAVSDTFPRINRLVLAGALGMLLLVAAAAVPAQGQATPQHDPTRIPTTGDIPGEKPPQRVMDEPFTRPPTLGAPPEMLEPPSPTAYTSPRWTPVDPGTRFRSLQRFGAAVFAPQMIMPEKPTPEKPAETPPVAGEPVKPAPRPILPPYYDPYLHLPAETGIMLPPRAPEAAPPAREPESTAPTGHQPAGQVAPPGETATGLALPPYYILGPGDALVVNVWTRGREQHAVTVTINPEGFVFLPIVGRLVVAGQTLAEVRDAVRRAYDEIYETPEVTVVVSAQRMVELYVLGDVRRPGKYNLSGMATVLSALYAAGGPSESGSYRNVRLLRLGQEPRSVDLYQYLLYGEAEGDVMLQPGDRIFVPPAQHEVGLAGEVRRPARYELDGEVTLSAALAMAGGLGPQGYGPGVEVWRTQDRRQWSLVNVDAAGGADGLVLRDGDLVVVKPLLNVALDTVEIRGAVRRPDVYALGPGLTAAELIQMAQGPTEGANLEKALVWRVNENMGYDVIRFAAREALAGERALDIALQPRDIVQVLQQERMEVTLEGPVVRPGIYPVGRGMRVSDLVLLGGGLLPEAYGGRADLLRLTDDNKYAIIPVAVADALSGDAAANLALLPGDRLAIKLRDEAVAEDTVHIDGFVQRPGSYFRYEGMKVSDLIAAAGGLAPGAGIIEYNKGRIVGRGDPEKLFVGGSLEHYAIDPDVVLHPDDQISVQGFGDFQQRPPVVMVRGRIERRGAYALVDATDQEANTVWGVIQRAGGLLPDADPNGMVLYRGYAELLFQAQDLQQIFNTYNREAEADEQKLVEATAGAMRDAVNQQITQAFASQDRVAVVIPPRRMQLEQTLRAIPVDGAKIMTTNGLEGNLKLEKGDILVIPQKRDTVAVVGAVVRPGAVPFRENATVNDYIAMVGGAAEDAALRRVVVLSPNGSVRSITKGNGILAGDVIVVPSEYIFRSYKMGSTWSAALRSLAGLAALFIATN